MYLAVQVWAYLLLHPVQFANLRIIWEEEERVTFKVGQDSFGPKLTSSLTYVRTQAQLSEELKYSTYFIFALFVR